MGKTIYVMDACRYSRLTVRRKLVCARCDEPLRIGDRVLSSMNGRRTKIYHAKCFLSYYR